MIGGIAGERGRQMTASAARPTAMLSTSPVLALGGNLTNRDFLAVFPIDYVLASAVPRQKQVSRMRIAVDNGQIAM